jgi:hypothetical protein
MYRLRVNPIATLCFCLVTMQENPEILDEADEHYDGGTRQSHHEKNLEHTHP